MADPRKRQPCVVGPNFIYFHSLFSQPAVDPGFPRGGGANPRGREAPRYKFAKFSPKLHEIERIWIPKGEHASLAPPPL